MNFLIFLLYYFICTCILFIILYLLYRFIFKKMIKQNINDNLFLNLWEENTSTKSILDINNNDERGDTDDKQIPTFF